MTGGVITTAPDDLMGIVRVIGTGVWTPAYVDAHFVELRAHIDAIRDRGDDVLVLVDLSGSDVQPAATAERIKANTDDLYRPGDRIAVVVGSCLAKMQMRRTVNPSFNEVFVSANAALTWLMAYRSLSRAPIAI
jgi:hypothetical protein